MYNPTPGFASEHSHLRGFSLQLQEWFSGGIQVPPGHKAAEEEIYTGWKEEIPKSCLNIQGRPFDDRVCKF
jgi:hypothetical protein